jgi:hypothetical protein
MFKYKIFLISYPVGSKFINLTKIQTLEKVIIPFRISTRYRKQFGSSKNFKNQCGIFRFC